MDASNIVLCMMFLLCFHMTTTSVPAQSRNQLLGIKYIRYENFDGTLDNGICCDEPAKTAGSCSPNMCDTAFKTCGTSDPLNHCGVIQGQKTPTTYNTTALTFGRRLGNGINKTSSFYVIKFPFVNATINITVEAVDTPEQGQSGPFLDIAGFSFVVDWLDPLFVNPPNFRRHILNDTRARLILDIVSQCSRFYFTEDCSVYCKPDKIHYGCSNNGTIYCLPGWTGPKCLTMINYCPGNLCQHGSTCVPILLGYTCTCAPGFSGQYCGISSSTTAATTASTTTSSTSNTTATTLTTASSNQTSSKPSGSDDDDHIVILASGLAIGLFLLLAALVGSIFYIIGRKKRMKEMRSEVAPEEKPQGHHRPDKEASKTQVRLQGTPQGQRETQIRIKPSALPDVQ